jgi:MFS family permease
MEEGLHVVFSDPILRRIALCTATSNLGSSIYGAVILLFAYDTLGLTPSLVTLVFFFAAVGGVLGAVSVAPVTKRLGVGRAIGICSLAGAGTALVVLARSALPMVVMSASFFMVSFTGVIYNINQLSLRQTIVADRLQGRMNATMRTIVWGTLPLGSVIGGILGTLVGIESTIVAGALVSGLAVVFVAFGPVWRLKEIPKPPARQH